MPTPPAPLKYPLDPTGQNPNNRIVDEPYVLVGGVDTPAIDENNNPVIRTNRVLVPKSAPFFTSSLVLVDDQTNLPLIRGSDYHVVELHQELSMKYGKEIASAIVVTNKAISLTGRITYQTIGWHYVNNSEAIKRLYESLLEDERPVAFENIMNKPLDYPPTNHRHLMYDVFGFEAVVDGLERIKRAITIGQTDMAIRLIRGLLARFTHGELETNIPNKRIVTYDALLAVLSRLNILSTLSVRILNGPRRKGQSFSIEISSDESVVLNRIIYVTVQGNLGNSELVLFNVSNPNSTADPNHIRLNAQGKAHVSFYVSTDETLRGDNLYVGLRYNIERPDFDAISADIDALTTPFSNDYFRHKTESSNYLILHQIEDIPPIYRFNEKSLDPRRHLFARSF